MSAPPRPDEEIQQDDMLAALATMSDEELHELLSQHEELERRLDTEGPQTPDELHAWLVAEMGLDIPRTSVCEDHDAPFDFLSDLYFEEADAALLMANRGGSKTFLVAVLHWLNSKFKPGCESCTFGATEAQSLRAYAHLKGWIYDKDGNLRHELKNSLMRETNFKNGSKVEILPGTPAAVNGPHPQKAHADEIELMDDGTWQESRNLTVSKKTEDGLLIKPQDIATSTRKGPNGRMQQLIDEIGAAVEAGYKPPRKLYKWCIKETAAPVKNCQIANPKLPEALKCPCHTIRKGVWSDGSPRLLKDICGGDFSRSGGWQPFGDVSKQFTENDPETFEIQQLCQKPEMTWHYVPSFSEERHAIRNFLPDPRNGPIFQSVDWGGTNPHAVNWYQLLRFEIEAQCWVQEEEEIVYKRLKEGTLVCFDEIYIAEIGNVKLGEMVKSRENFWRQQLKAAGILDRFEIFERYADPQGKAARTDWKSIGLRTTWHTTREFEEHIKDVRVFFDDDRFAVAGDRCEMFIKEIKKWRRDPKTGKQIDEFNHVMSNFRYMCANLKKVRKKALRIAENLPQSRTIPRASVRVTRPEPGPIAFRGRTSTEYERWRKGLGAPVTR
jgi:hypothetical protein